MARRKVSTEAQIIALFTGLSDVKKEMVMFGLNAIMSNNNPVPDAPTRTRAPRAPRSQPAQEPLRIVADKEDEGPKCVACNYPQDYQDHFKPSPHYHPFVSSVPSAGKKSRSKTVETKSAASTDAPQVSVGIAAGTSGD